MDKFWNEKELATILKKTAQTIRFWRMKGIGPEYLKFGGTVLYDPIDVEKWIRERRVKTNEKRK